MLYVLDLIIYIKLTQRLAQGGRGLQPLQADLGESPATYSGYLWPLRLVLALHYLRRKRALWQEYRVHNAFPDSAAEFEARLLSRLRCGPRRPFMLLANGEAPGELPRLPKVALLGRSLAVVVLAASMLALGSYGVRRGLDGRKQRAALRADLPEYCDRVHLGRAYRTIGRLLNEPEPPASAPEQVLSTEEQVRRQFYAELRSTDREAETLRQRLIAVFPRQPEVQVALTAALTALTMDRDPNQRPEDPDLYSPATGRPEQQSNAEVAAPPRVAPDHDTQPEGNTLSGAEHAAPSAERKSARGRLPKGGNDSDPEALIRSFAQVNRAMEAASLPYHVMPTVLIGPCASLFGIEARAALIARDLEKRMGMCQSTLVLPYELATPRPDVYAVGSDHYLIHRLRRLGTLPFLENALGITYRSGHGSQVYLERIHLYAIESVLPTLAPRGRNLMFPWQHGIAPLADEAAFAVRKSLQLVFDPAALGRLEAFADRVVHHQNLISQARLHQTLLGMGHREQSNQEDLLMRVGLDALSSVDDESTERATASQSDPLKDYPLEILRLEERLAEAIARHEVSHQIQDRHPRPLYFQQDRWQTLRARHHIREVSAFDELAPYLVQLAAAADTRHIVLTQLTSFALNLFAEQGREYLASRLILLAMWDLNRRGPEAQPRLSEGPVEIVAAYRALIKESDDRLGQLARSAYRMLLDEALPLPVRIE